MPVRRGRPAASLAARRTAVEGARVAGQPAAESLQVKFVLDPADKVLRAYLEDDHRVTGIIGPRASAKSSASIIKLYKNALGQPAGADGWKRRRTVVVRRTYAELEHTTLPSWKYWLPEAVFGDVRMTHPPVHRIIIPPVDWEVLFLALDKAEDIKFLNSMEMSDAWVNEAWEVAREIITGLVLTTNRFPNPGSPEGCYRPQVLWDSNGPPFGHWIGYMSGLEVPPERERAKFSQPDTWSIHIQPPGVLPVRDGGGEIIAYDDNPEAENRKHRSPSYYRDAVAGATPEMIQRYLIGRPGGVTSGQPVWPTFRQDTHVAKVPLRLVPGWPIIVGMDFGRTPAAVVAQKPHDQQWRAIDEVDGMVTSAREFTEQHVLPLVGRLIADTDPDQQYEWELILYVDPAGEHGSEATDTTPIREVRSAVGSNGRVVSCLSGLRFTVRRDTLNVLMKRTTDSGGPAMLISPNCRSLIRAAAGGYCYAATKRLGSGDVVVDPRPDKRNPHGHIANAWEYAIVGHDRGAIILGQTATTRMETTRPLAYFARVAKERREAEAAAHKPFVAARGGGFFERRRKG